MAVFFPFSRDRQPPGSFQVPVPPPASPPGGGRQIKVCFSEDWLPYIMGSLFQLTMNTTWAVSTQDDLERVLSQANDLLYIFQRPTDCEEMPSAASESDDCDMGCCLRFQNGKLQTFSCGVWSDVAGQENAPAGTPQPPTADSPAAGGGCSTFNGTLPGSGFWLLPVPVSTGDTILIGNAVGATSDSGGIVWRCPDGSLAVPGNSECITGIPFTESGAPLPSVQAGKIIANIGGTPYDIYSGSSPFTVPSGITNAQVFFQMNYAVLADANGQITFDVLVCNNQLAGWSHDFDLAISPAGLVSYTIAGTSGPGSQWIPGTGWQSLGYTGFGNAYKQLQMRRVMPVASTLTNLTLTYDDGVTGAGYVQGAILLNAIALAVAPASQVPGTNVLSFIGSQAISPSDVFEIQIQGGQLGGSTPPTGNITALRLQVSGVGADPFV